MGDQVSAMDLKDAVVTAVNGDQGAEQRYIADLLNPGLLECACCPCKAMCQTDESPDIQHLLDAKESAFEIRFPTLADNYLHHKVAAFLDELPGLDLVRKRNRLSMVAENEELCRKWVFLIDAGPR